MRPDGPGSRSSATASRLVWGGFAAVLALVVAAGAVSLLRRLAEGPPVLGEVPPFDLTERSGRTVTLDDLRGSDWIADFVFTRCAGICPMLSARMARLQQQLNVGSAPDLRLVSFTVDPAFDTPEVLRTYAERLRADERAWLFLTGPRQSLYDLIKDGFRLSVAAADTPSANPDEMITHSDRFVLVDRQGRIRGYYHGTDEDSMQQLLEDVPRVRREEER